MTKLTTSQIEAAEAALAYYLGTEIPQTPEAKEFYQVGKYLHKAGQGRECFRCDQPADPRHGLCGSHHRQDVKACLERLDRMAAR